MKWCGGMTFGHTEDYATDRDAPHATGPCGPAFARAFLIIESFRERCGGVEVPDYAYLLEGDESILLSPSFLPFRAAMEAI